MRVAVHHNLMFLLPFGGYNSTGFPIPIAGTISDLYVNIGINTSITNVTYTIYKNGSPTALTTTASALATGLFTDLTHSFTVVAGDLINLTVEQSTGGNPSAASASVTFSS